LGSTNSGKEELKDSSAQFVCRPVVCWSVAKKRLNRSNVVWDLELRGPRIDVGLLDASSGPAVGRDTSGGVLGHTRTWPSVDIFKITQQVAARESTSRWCVLTECPKEGCKSCQKSAQETPTSIKCDECETGYNLNSETRLCEGTYIAYR